MSFEAIDGGHLTFAEKVAGILPDTEGGRMLVSLRPSGERFNFYPGNQGSLDKAHTFDIPGTIG